MLRAFIDAAPKPLTGAELMDLLAIASGSIYPILARFESAKWLTSEWERGAPVQLGRPRRRYYTLTALGARKAQTQLEFIMRGAPRYA
ncbi:PadR family transcriptional regulator [Steroidobacter agaridevorans]|uniref:PadR family transcriptional regulator n=1 Tax=Steroidobacter agaridevorans TaxID=2695856 RepID=UPI00192A2350|nr:helix-turn-helix transcriptional regulator [Steroidobacter agaridevorans]